MGAFLAPISMQISGPAAKFGQAMMLELYLYSIHLVCLVDMAFLGSSQRYQSAKILCN